eukprot:6492704-Amphidinium_carterae.2
MANLLRNTGDLYSVLLESLEMVLPATLRVACRTLMQESSSAVPHASTISRWRFLLDGAYMMCKRVQNTSTRCFRYLMADASKQHHREFEHILERSVPRDAVARLHMEAVVPLPPKPEDVQFRRTGDIENPDVLAEDMRLLESLSAQLHWHHLPVIALNTGRSTLSDKFASILHGIYLETGTVASLQDYTSSMCVMTSDLGTEFMLNTVAPTPINTILPWVGAADMDDLDAEFASEVCFQSALAVPGILHVLHNATADLLSYVTVLNESAEQLVTVANFLREPEHKQRLSATCFSAPIASEFRREVCAFRGKVVRQRWGSMADAVQALLHLRRPLVRYWNLDTYMTGGRVKEGGELAQDLQVVDDCLTSDRWWCHLLTLHHLFTCISKAMEWAEQCRCHCNMNFKDAPLEIRQRWLACPLRGVRLSEIASGEFLCEIETIAATTAAALSLELAEFRDPVKVAECLHQFELGRSHVLFTLSLKFAAFEEPPLLLLAGSHHDATIARRAVQVCFDSDCKHSAVAALHSEALRDEVASYLDGQELHELHSLHTYLASFYFGNASERRVEGGHALIHLRSTHARHRSEAFDSLALRLPEIRRGLSGKHKDQNMMPQLLHALQLGRTPRSMAEHLGLGRHASVSGIQTGWDREYRRVVYRADDYTLYKAPLMLLPRDMKDCLPQPLERADLQHHDDYARLKHHAAVDEFLG